MQIPDRPEGDDRHDVSICGRRILCKSPDQRARTYVHFGYHVEVDSEKQAIFGETSAIGRAINIPLISSGCVQTLEDRSVLHDITGIDVAIVGRAFFERRIGIERVLAVARETEADLI